MASLLERDSKTDFVSVPDVPIFMEHTTRARDGSPMVFTRRELEGIVNTCNQRYSAGLPAAVIIGHTSDSPDAPEKEAVGFAGPFRLARMPGGKWGIYATLRFRREHADAMKRYPRVSVELWPDEDLRDSIIDPVCLIGGSVPRLDLPGVKFRRRGQPFRYSLSPSLVQEVLSALRETAEWKWLQARMEAEGGTIPRDTSNVGRGDQPRANRDQDKHEKEFGPWHAAESNRDVSHIEEHNRQREAAFGRYGRPGRPLSFQRIKPGGVGTPTPSDRALEETLRRRGAGEAVEYEDVLVQAGGADPRGKPAFP